MNRILKKAGAGAVAAGLGTAMVLGSAGRALADEAALDTGDTAWMLTSTALVLMMTIPGLALFYGGMVRKKMSSQQSCKASPLFA